MRQIIHSAVILFLALSVIPARSSFSESGSLVTPQGRIEFKLYVPSSYHGDPVPLVVVLHGCSQDADIISKSTGWNELAEREGFIVLYPQQSRLRNIDGCWNWFFEANQHRGFGEPYLVAEATKHVMQRYHIDRSRVYICGMSAGAAMALITAICYPDVFAAVGSHSGLEYRAADSIGSAYDAMENGGPDPEITARAAFVEIMKSGTQRAALPAIVFHGSSDPAVNIINGEQTTEQFTLLNKALGVAMERTESAGFEKKPYTLVRYHTGGVAIVEYWIVDGLEHAWSGGSPDGGVFNDPEAPSATQHMWEFFREHSL